MLNRIADYWDFRQFVEIQGLYERNPTAGVEQCRDFLASSERFSFSSKIGKTSDRQTDSS